MNTNMNLNAPLADLSEQQLLQRFDDLVRHDRANTAQLLAHIAEIDDRKLWAKHACSSMFAFCMERFHMSESMTAKRIWAARTARRFPVILAMVADGELHLSGINQLGKHLTQDNHRSLLQRAKHKSSRKIDLLVAELAPRPDVPSRVRALPRSIMPFVSARALPVSPAVSSGDTREPSDHLMPSCSPAPAGVAEPAAGASIAAVGAMKRTAAHKQIVSLAPRRFKIEVTVDQQTHDRLRALQDLLSHQSQSADPAVIVSRAIALLLDDTLKKKAAVVAAPRAGGAPATRRTRTIPAAIRRAVWKRDVGRCTFADEQGQRCRATRCIEYHHEFPYGKGGRHEVENLALRCRAHNQYQADLDFGREFMRLARHTGKVTL
jgi:hypothetical protein